MTVVILGLFISFRFAKCSKPSYVTSVLTEYVRGNYIIMPYGQISLTQFCSWICDAIYHYTEVSLSYQLSSSFLPILIQYPFRLLFVFIAEGRSRQARD